MREERPAVALRQRACRARRKAGRVDGGIGGSIGGGVSISGGSGACAQPNPSPSLMPNLSHPACVCDSRCNFAGKKIKEAHAKVKSGTATEIEVTIVKKMDKGTHPGYVVLDENGDMRNA